MECSGSGALPALLQGSLGGLPDLRDEARFPLDVLEQVKNPLMSRAQVRAVALCLVINLIDGFDLLVTSFVGPASTHEWGLSPSRMGVLLSGGLAGMAIGGLLLAPLADRAGRRRLTLGCLALASLSMLAAALSQDFGQLLACRLVTGAAVGAMAASLPVLTSDYANHWRRGLVVALITTGYGLGSVIAGIASTLLLSSFEWRSMFVFGCVVTAILFAVALRYLPESMDYLVACRRRHTLDKLNRILASMGRAAVEDLPAAPSAASRKVAARCTVPRGQRRLGAVLLGLLVSRLGPRRLTAAYFGIGALALILFSFALGTLATALVAAVLVGLFLNGTGHRDQRRRAGPLPGRSPRDRPRPGGCREQARSRPGAPDRRLPAAGALDPALDVPDLRDPRGDRAVTTLLLARSGPASRKPSTRPETTEKEVAEV